MSREQARGYVCIYIYIYIYIYIGESCLYGFSGYKVQFRQPRTISYKRVALYQRKSRTLVSAFFKMTHYAILELTSVDISHEGCQWKARRNAICITHISGSIDCLYLMN